MVDRSPSDEELVTRANAGDEQAFEQLYHRHRDWVFRLAFRFTGDRDQALDVLQETFAYFFEKFPGFVLTAKLTTFLFPVVKHGALTLRRKHRPTLDVDDLSDILPVAGHARDGDASRLLHQLPMVHREVLILRFAEDRSLAEIAEALSLPLGTVKSRLHNAILALRTLAQG